MAEAIVGSSTASELTPEQHLLRKKLLDVLGEYVEAKWQYEEDLRWEQHAIEFDQGIWDSTVAFGNYEEASNRCLAVINELPNVDGTDVLHALLGDRQIWDPHLRAKHLRSA